MAFEGIGDIWNAVNGNEEQGTNLFKEITGHKADNLVDVAELGVGIWAGFEKASLELKRTLGTSNLKRIAASKEAILARAARKAARKELAKIRGIKGRYKPVPINDQELAKVFGGAKDPRWRPNQSKVTGADRAAKYSSFWKNASVKEAIKKFTPDAKPVFTDKGKIIFKNTKTGIEIVYDKNGNYFRIFDTNLQGKRTALDISGNKIPNNILTDQGTQRGLNRSEYNSFSHFNNTDCDFHLKGGK